MVKKKIAELVLPNNGSRSVSPENISTHANYSFTLNPEVQYYEIQDGIERFNTWNAHMYKELKRLHGIESLKIWPEISQSGRLHFHGIIKIKDVIEFALVDVPLLIRIGHLEIDTINDEDVWNKYIRKSIQLMKPLMSSNIYYDQNGSMILLK